MTAWQECTCTQCEAARARAVARETASPVFHVLTIADFDEVQDLERRWQAKRQEQPASFETCKQFATLVVRAIGPDAAEKLLNAMGAA